jgi:hypothetical protein
VRREKAGTACGLWASCTQYWVSQSVNRSPETMNRLPQYLGALIQGRSPLPSMLTLFVIHYFFVGYHSSSTLAAKRPSLPHAEVIIGLSHGVDPRWWAPRALTPPSNNHVDAHHHSLLVCQSERSSGSLATYRLGRTVATLQRPATLSDYLEHNLELSHHAVCLYMGRNPPKHTKSK